MPKEHSTIDDGASETYMSDGHAAYDVIVVGGGPAGLMAAIAAREAGATTLLIEKGNKLGRKLGISGGGRCNVTNAKPLPELMANIPGNSRFLHSALHRFSNQDVRRFFEGLGIRLKEEDRGRVFPVSDKAATVVKALVTKVFEVGVEVWEDTPVKRLLLRESASVDPAKAADGATADGGTEAYAEERPASGGVVPADREVYGVLLRDGRTITAKSVVLCTGGASVPKTGSTGDAYPWARAAGHTIVNPYPTEVPLTSDEWFIRSRTIQGISLRQIDVTILDSRGKRLTTETGDILFTHLGLSGPAALRCSHYVSTYHLKHPGTALTARIDCMPSLPRGDLLAAFERARKQQARKHLGNVLREVCDEVPERLMALMVKRCEVDGSLQMAQVTNQAIQDLTDAVKQFPLQIRGTLPLEQATVTGGGVSVREIDPRTMASKRCARLFFAGEVMDVHAHTGGYNITVAFSTGHCAGTSAAEAALMTAEVSP